MSTTATAHYELRKSLGEGAFGQVFEAWDSQLQRLVAIKRLKNNPASDLTHEARLAASLKHPAFVKIHALENVDGDQSIVMELIDGPTLRQVLRERGNLPLADALAIARQIATAMSEAHDAQLVHGDLKPSNLMLEKSGAVRILDFGIAAKSDLDATLSSCQGDLQGTIAYMAPERLSGQPLSTAADIYALGVIIYEMLSGKRPYPDVHGLALAAAIAQGDCSKWPYPPEMPPAMRDLIEHFCAKAGSKRPANMQAALQALDALQSVAAATNTTNTTRRSFLQNMGLSKRSKQIGASLLALSILGGGLYYYADTLLQMPLPVLSRFSKAQTLKTGWHELQWFDRKEHLAAAERHFSAVLAHDAENAAAVTGLGLVYIFRTRTDEHDDTWLKKAEAASQTALRLNDQLALSHTLAGWVSARMSRHEEALSAFARALQLDPGEFYAWYGKAESLSRLGREEEAQSFIRQAMQRFPRERIFADILGFSFFRQKRYQDAEQAFRQSIALQPDSTLGYANLYGALMPQGRGDEALKVLQQGLQAAPSANLYSNLGTDLFMRGDYVGAADAFRRAVSAQHGNPNNYIYWANLADALLWIPGKQDEAKQAYRRAVELLAPALARKPNNVTLLSRLGLYTARSGEHQRAEPLMQKAMQLAPKNAEVHFRAGLAFELGGKREMALEAINKARVLGYAQKLLDSEPDLVNLRRDKRYSPN